jgi:hypothetical protein
MPNWVINNVQVEDGDKLLGYSNPALMAEIKQYVRREYEDGEVNEFDFSNIVPEPEGLYDQEAVQVNYGTFTSSMPAWYEWHCANWGTKWNSNEASAGDTGFSFNTAWSTSEPVIKALSEKFPTVTFCVEYADEDLGGGNCGIYAYENGELVREEEGSYEFACDLWGYEPEEEEEEETIEE